MLLSSLYAAEYRWRAILLALAGASLVASLPGVLSRPLTGDEVSSAIVITRSGPIAMALQVTRGESTPPLWYSLGWAVHLVGVPIVWIRPLSSVAMAFGVVLTAVVARRSGLPMWTAGLAGMLVAFGDQFVEHGGELRAYALFCMLAVLFSLLLQGAVPRASRSRLWSIAAVVAAGTLTHYFFLFSVVAALIWLWINPDARPVRWRIVGMIGVGLVPLALWSPALAHQYGANRYGWIGRFSVHTISGSVSGLFVNPWVLRSAFPGAYLVGTVMAAVGLVMLARRPAGRLCALFAGVPIVGSSAFWMFGSPVFDVRNLLGAGPFLAIAIATSTLGFRRFGVAAGFVALTLLLAAFADAHAHLSRTDFRRVSASLVAEGWGDRDPVALFGSFYGSVPLAWYLPGHPRLDKGKIRDAHCPDLFVVAENARGRSWLHEYAAGASARRAPADGVSDRGPPSKPIVIARIPMTGAVLRAAMGAGARILGVRGYSGCVVTS